MNGFGHNIRMQNRTEEKVKKPRKHVFLKIGKYAYLVFHFLLFWTIIFASSALYVAFRPDGLDLVNTYVLEPFGIRYSHSEGSLLEGFTLYDVHTDTIAAKEFSLTYRLDRILKGEHVIDKIVIDGLQIHLNDFINDEDSPWPLPEFKLSEVRLTNLQLISDYPLELDLIGRNGSYDGDTLNFASLNASVKSRYAGGALTGSLRGNTIKGVALVYPNHRELDPTVGRFTILPSSQLIRIDELSDTRARLSTVIDRLDSIQDPLTAAHAVRLNMDYRYDNEYLDFDARYLVKRNDESVQMRHRLRYALSGTTTTAFEGNITSPRALPSYLLRGEFTDEPKGLTGRLTLGTAMLDLSSSDYEHFGWNFKTDHPDLKFLSMLPPELQFSPLKMRAHGSYQLSNEKLQGSVHLDHNDGIFDGTVETLNSRYRLDGNLTLPPDAPLWKHWRHKPPEHLSLSLIHETNTTKVQMEGSSFDLTASLQKHTLKGSGGYLGTVFDLQGNLENALLTLDITTSTPSLLGTLSHLQPITLHPGEYYDAEIHSKTHLTYGDTLQAHTEISVPWYAAVLDSQRAYAGIDGTASLSYDNGKILIDRYRFSIADHIVTSNKPSRLRLNENRDLIVDELWIYDSLRLSGIISGTDLSASLRLASDRFSYDGPEGQAHMAANITFTRDADAVQKLEGSLTILDAKITYLPLQQFKVMDDDIIIIQDVRPPSTTNLSMNLHITSAQPIRYSTKELDLQMNSDITLWRDPYGPMQILGMVKIPSGSAKTGGKLFEIEPSEIYFGGDVPLNPYLNLTVKHEVDYKKILIYITHTLDSPIFLFHSDPIMSQNDIMSYILFGMPANTAKTGDASTSTIRADATNFMLGAGLKGLISGATKLQIDTMNILTTQQGGMGFEVGAKLNKNLRVLYKNNTLSSVLVQYTVNQWLRVDADVHELGQGINVIYIKDFKDFLPRNKPKKK